ncbi:MAG TPA: dTDP-4-dehydrorhamnose 3,5-epimerase [Nocardioidaceae bacterium]|nr:dTDP-4-dehydrorhamnose 3,5-epimerase [Nocardioidaceae bacterium]
MEIRELSIPGAFEVAPKVHGDDRGAFLEWFRADRFAEATGHPFTLAQANASVSAAGAVRGIHFAQLPPSQAKWVTCLWGAVLDVVVDIRVGSPTYGAWESVLLDDADRRAVYLSEGLGHAFMALQDASVVSYLCSTPYAPGREHGVHPLDPAVGIEWPTTGRDGSPVRPLLSAKDADAPTLAEAERAGLLPSYDAAQAYVSSLRH